MKQFFAIVVCVCMFAGKADAQMTAASFSKFDAKKRLEVLSHVMSKFYASRDADYKSLKVGLIDKCMLATAEQKPATMMNQALFACIKTAKSEIRQKNDK